MFFSLYINKEKNNDKDNGSGKKELCEKLSIDLQGLTYLGVGREESDGTVYTYHEGNRKKVLMILAIKEADKEQLRNLEMRVKYAFIKAYSKIYLIFKIVYK